LLSKAPEVTQEPESVNEAESIHEVEAAQEAEAAQETANKDQQREPSENSEDASDPADGKSATKGVNNTKLSSYPIISYLGIGQDKLNSVRIKLLIGELVTMQCRVEIEAIAPPLLITQLLIRPSPLLLHPPKRSHGRREVMVLGPKRSFHLDTVIMSMPLCPFHGTRIIKPSNNMSQRRTIPKKS